MAMEQGKKAVLLGATGLIGAFLLELLLDAPAYETVTVITRKRLPEHPKLRQVVLPDFGDLEQYGDAFAGAEDVFCCLGTTIKQAGSQEQFRIVDYTYPVLAARLAQAAGARRYLVVSAMGASAQSRVFYSRVKGEMEEAIRALGLPGVSIMRPSLLLGERQPHSRKERQSFRLGETVAIWLFRRLSFLFRGPLRKYRAIEARDVAAIMLRVAQMYLPGTHIYENDQLHAMAPRSR